MDTRRITSAVGPGMVRDINVTGSVPETAGALVVSVTAVAPTAAGFLTVFPLGPTRPSTSTLNFTAGQSVANLVILKSNARVFSVYNGSSGNTDLVVDLLGWFAGPIHLDQPSVHLPDGTVPAPYHGVLGAVGRVPPYTWTVQSAAWLSGR